MAVQSPFLSPSNAAHWAYLWDLRKAAGMTLRDVEGHQTARYPTHLSQLETGRISTPSPRSSRRFRQSTRRSCKIFPIACSFERLMELAGHIPSAFRSQAKRSSRLSTFASENLTPEEEDELLKYLAFIRMRKGKKR